MPRNYIVRGERRLLLRGMPRNYIVRGERRLPPKRVAKLNRNTVQYRVVEIFHSMQGEGYNTGKPVVFLRFGGCDLHCPWCDTDHENYDMLDEITIMQQITAFNCNAVILTGGEPLIQPELERLLRLLKSAELWVGVETNGLTLIPPAMHAMIDYLSLSPKAHYAHLYTNQSFVQIADELRIVVDGEIQAFCEYIREHVQADHYFLTPCEQYGAYNVAECVTLLGQLNRRHERNKWQLSLQTHKLGGFR